MNSDALIGIIAVLLVGVFFFFTIIRQLTLWYFKINTITENQEITNKLLAEQNNILSDILNKNTPL